MTSTEKKTQSEQKGNSLSKQIKKAVKGLFYTSETDAEIEFFAGDTADAVTQENLLSQIGKPKDTIIKETDFETFFSRLTAIQDWFEDEEKETAQKFTVLHDLLKSNLKDLKVFKVGNIEFDIYVIGLDTENNLTGIKTQSVET